MLYKAVIPFNSYSLFARGIGKVDISLQLFLHNFFSPSLLPSLGSTSNGSSRAAMLFRFALGGISN